MLMTGSEYLGSIRDGRRVYIGSERVDDVTTHPAFRNSNAGAGLPMPGEIVPADCADRRAAPKLIRRRAQPQ
jgi:hypothetical protein